MEKNITQYQSYLKKRSLRPTTIKNYLWHVNRFFDFLADKKISPPLLKKYQTMLLNSRKNVGSLNLHFIILNDYLKFSKIKYDFALLSHRRSGLKVLSNSQLNNFLRTPSLGSLISRRDRALLEILYQTGLKVGKIIKLKIRDIDTVKKEILSADKNIPLNPLTWSFLEKYLTLRHDSNPWLFINFDRAQKNSIDNHLSVRSVERIIDKYARQLKPPLIINPQILRNTLAQRLKSQGSLPNELEHNLHFTNPKSAKQYWQRL